LVVKVVRKMISDISDEECVKASQRFEMFSDISDTECVKASQRVEQTLSDEEVLRASQEVENGLKSVLPSETEVATSAVGDGLTGRFRDPVSLEELDVVQRSRYPRKTVGNAMWAVTVFGQWRANRNARCLGGDEKCDVYLDKPFASMTVGELAYALPLFIYEVRKADGTDYPPASLRMLVLALQKFMEINGRVEKFLSDPQYKVCVL
jgi:hypothetical protein